MEGFYLMEGHSSRSRGKHAKAEDEEMNGHQKACREGKQHKAWQEYLERRCQRNSSQTRSRSPSEQRKITALLLKTPLIAPTVWTTASTRANEAQAVLPIAVIYGMFDFIVDPIQRTLLMLTTMICVVSGVSILVSIYNSMSERRHEIAIMRALGAGRSTVMTIILLESTLLSPRRRFASAGWWGIRVPDCQPDGSRSRPASASA